MRKALLVGFTYSGDKKLPGITIDLYIAYCFLKEAGWKDNEITVFTDIEKNDETHVLKKGIADKIVDTDVLSFIDTLKDKNQYIKYKYHGIYNNFKATLEFCTCKREDKEIDNLFIYYTGHSEEGNIVLPQGTLYPFNDIRDFISSNFKNIFCVLDCCERGIILPFSLQDNIYRLSSTGEEGITKSDFLCISSCLENEKTIASKTGSFFTKTLFEIIKEKNIHIKDILSLLRNKINMEYYKNNKKYKQTVNISSSYPDIYLIFYWMYYPTKGIKISDRGEFLEIFL